MDCWLWQGIQRTSFKGPAGICSSACSLWCTSPSVSCKWYFTIRSIGAVLSHIMPDGEERPIAFASCTLANSERNYAQLEKEALSLIVGVKKFHPYFCGRQFTLMTYYKPLATILGPTTGVPTKAAVRMQRWAQILSAYSCHHADSDHADSVKRAFSITHM